jgi:hypothetical protein
VRQPRKLVVAVSFDGVVHAATTHDFPFNSGKVLDPPVPGMLSWLIALVRDGRFKVCISSARNTAPGGIEVMIDWLVENGVPIDLI